MRTNEKVRVYRNLRRNGPNGEPIYSVQAKRPNWAGKKRWIVVGHVEQIHLRDVEFKVSAAGRARVLRERRKSVHAYVVGAWVGAGPAKLAKQARYNPYETPTFIDRESGDTLLTASRARVDADGVCYDP